MKIICKPSNTSINHANEFMRCIASFTNESSTTFSYQSTQIMWDNVATQTTCTIDMKWFAREK